MRRRRVLAGLSSLGALALVGKGSALARAPTPRAGGRPPWDPAHGPGTEGAETISIDLPQLQYPGAWNPRPGAMRKLASELRLRTRLEPAREPSTVRATAKELFDTPFLYVAGEGGLPPLGSRAEAKLRLFVDLGGLILFDSADGGTDLGFERDVGQLVGRMSPGSVLSPVARDHVLFRSFYMIDTPLGRTSTHDSMLGLQEEGRLKVLLMRNDLGGAFATRPDGLFAHACVPGGAAQREWAFRLGVNILLYATCTDYKADRAHVETLMRARRWR
jgi:hypothetical protein